MSVTSARYWDRLWQSFAAVYAALEVPRIARRAVVVLLVIHTFLSAYSAYVHSPTLNEPAHLVAGLSHWTFGRFEIYRVNPPLVKMVAALPVMAVGYEEDWSGFYDGPGARPEMSMGEDFVAANGERSFFLFMIARWACIPFSWLGAIVCYLWARDLYGRPSGVLAAAIWCFEPNILAHASLMTPDAHATSLGLAACYTFWRWLKKPTWGQAALTGVVLGLAELAKTTLILFYPLWPLMWLIYRWRDRHSMAFRDWLREAGMLVLRMLIGLYVLNLGYVFEGSLSQLKDFHFVSDLFTGSDPLAPDTRHPTPDTSPSNRFANTWLGTLPVPFPKNYLLGIDIQQKDFEHYGRPSYLRGEWREYGRWYYYLYACAIKVPIGLWLLSILALFFSIRRTPGFASSTANVYYQASNIKLSTSFCDQFILLFPGIVIFAVVSSKTGINEHMRYVLPSFPFFFVAISRVSQVFSLWFANSFSTYLTAARQVVYSGLIWPDRRSRSVPLFSMSLVAILGSWCIASTLWLYPHSLSYFNESIGGPLNGHKHLLGSNTDWGQDHKYLACWLAKRESNSEQDLNLTTYYLSNQDSVRLSEIELRPEFFNCCNVARTRFDSHDCAIVSLGQLRGDFASGAEIIDIAFRKDTYLSISQSSSPTIYIAYTFAAYCRERITTSELEDIERLTEKRAELLSSCFCDCSVN